MEINESTSTDIHSNRNPKANIFRHLISPAPCADTLSIRGWQFSTQTHARIDNGLGCIQVAQSAQMHDAQGLASRNAILSILIVTICDISMPFLCHFVPFWNQSRVILVILCLFITSREPSTREHRHLHHVLHGEGGTERARRIPVRGGERLVMKAPGLNSWERNPSMRNLWRTHSFKLKHLKVRNRGVETVVCLWKPDFWLTCMSFHDTPCRDSNNACPSCECHGFRPWLGSAS